MNDVTTDVGLVEGRPSCQGCGTTVLAAVTVHPSQGAYLVEDQVRGLQQWLTAWCDACAETELGDEPGWLMPEDADAATWPSLAADTITGRRWPAVGVCFARHNYIGGDGGEGEGSGSGWWRDLRVVAMARRLSCGSWPWAGTTVDPRDRSQWSAAASLGDLCHLTAGWLTGQIGSQLGYHGQVDVDEDQAPGLTAGLLALNAAGVCTRRSQGGHLGYLRTGSEAMWVQHAAVTGYANAADRYRLLAWADGTRYQVLTHIVRGRQHLTRPGQVVTWRDGQPLTEFGAQLSASEIRADLAGAGRKAVTAAVNALQVTVWDPVPGPNTLWEHLARELSPAATGPARSGVTR